MKAVDSTTVDIEDLIAATQPPAKFRSQGTLSRQSNEWRTPPHIIEAARDVLGRIDLDPASNDAANSTVGALKLYTMDMDGLTQPWHGHVWLNPPFSHAGKFAAKALAEFAAGQVEEVILLLSANAMTAKWFSPLLDHALCVLTGRLAFIGDDGVPVKGNTAGTVIVYVGPRPGRFATVFGEWGKIVLPTLTSPKPASINDQLPTSDLATDDRHDRRAAPDQNMAQRFLTLLDEGAESFTFQTFDDNKGRKLKSLTRVLHGTLAQHFDELVQLNQAGAGIFVVVNATNGRGRKADDIVRQRAVWQESDDVEWTGRLPLEPHIEVESSPRKYHRYLLVEGLSKEEHAAIMRVMASEFGSDPNATDLSRVLRLPGFDHCKGAPYRVRIVHESGAGPYTRDQMLAAFPPVVERSESSSGAEGEVTTVDARTTADLRSALIFLAAFFADRGLWLKCGIALTCLGQVGRELWLTASSMEAHHDPVADALKWDRDLQPRYHGRNEHKYRAVFAYAAARGWVNPATKVPAQVSKLSASAGELVGVSLPDGVRFKVESVSEMLARREVEWLVARLIEARGFGIIFGATTAGKTFIVLELLCAIALGIPFHGLKVRQGRVLYISTEGNVRNRLRAYMQHHGVSADALADLHFMKTSLDLRNPADVEQLIQEIKAQGFPQLDCIVVDTLNRAMPGGNENGSEDMGLMVAHGSRVGEALGAAFIYVHHSGKDETKGSRGHSSLKAAGDFELSVDRAGDARTLSAAKVKEGEDDWVVAHFGLEVIELGVDGEGELVTSCVVVPAAEAAKVGPTYQLPSMAMLAFDCLQATLDDKKLHIEPTMEDRLAGVHVGQLGVSVANWSDNFRRHSDRKGAEYNTNKQAFARAKAQLIKACRVVISQGNVWLKT